MRTWGTRRKRDREWKKAGRDSSTAQADSFAGAKEEENRRLAALGMTVGCCALMCFCGDSWLVGVGRGVEKALACSAPKMVGSLVPKRPGAKTTLDYCSV
jgi:hypothetical protein